MAMTDAVLVSGASTGIGYATATLLAHEGYLVFAGVRNDADGERVRASHHNIRSVRLDVRHRTDIVEAIDGIEQSGIPLFAAINNAGVAVAGPLEFLPADELHRQFDVNVFGSIALTQAALPLLRRARGRVIFMSSVSGQIAPPLLGPYAASKFALEALADSMRMELAPFGISVSVIQPGNVKTPIWEKGRRENDELAARMPQQARQYYGAAIDNLLRVTEREERAGIDADEVARVVLAALRAKRPRARYAVGNPPGWQRRMAALLPEHLRDRLIVNSLRRH
jgi:NAD(P)-dependent dehydrogenase (short-subunit alcohol dehydrogenase family)